MSGFEITYGRVADVTGQLRTETNNVSNALDKLAGEMASVRSELEGDTASSYDEAMAMWRKNVDDMRFLLNKAEQALQQVAQNYNETDLREGALWDALK
ncbi:MULTISPECIES: WXG100 family type VII secretion target [Streptomonospora]|uniref:ESAT-6-like protein n=2 Tax=Streptomonospora TaxID=104204 RepID=A0ABV9SRP0_9ACTN